MNGHSSCSALETKYFVIINYLNFISYRLNINCIMNNIIENSLNAKQCQNLAENKKVTNTSYYIVIEYK